jgi:hypothetical protein
LYKYLGEISMPEISRFYGIVISMYFKEHNPPHFHVTYGDREVQFDMNEGAFVKGILPSRISRLVLAWFEIHKDELIEMWETKQFRKIRPLQ